MSSDAERPDLVPAGPVGALQEIIVETMCEYGLMVSKVDNRANNQGLDPRFLLARELIRRFDAVAIMSGEPDDG